MLYPQNVTLGLQDNNNFLSSGYIVLKMIRKKGKRWGTERELWKSKIKHTFII